jgi:fatty-acyl-CoA synthase
MRRLWLYARAVRALWRVGLLRLGPQRWLAVWLAWRHCRGSLAFLAELAAIRAGSRLALVDDDGPLTFAELRDRFHALAGELTARHGVGPGGRIAVLGRNHRSLVVALLAATRTGADVVLLNPDSPPPVLAKSLAACAPARGGEAGDDSAPRAGAAPTLILHAADVDAAALAPHTPRLVVGDHLASPAGPLPKLGRAGRLDVLTAGSTGAPKPVSRRPTVGSLLPALLGLLDHLPMRLHQPTVCAVPFFHGHGLTTLAVALALAAPVHLARRNEIAPLLARTSLAHPPFVVSVPTLLGRWLAAGPVTTEIAAVLSGSAPLPPPLCRGLLAALGPVVYNLYGSTEAGIVALATPAMLVEAPGTVGHALPGTEVRIETADPHAPPAGQRGRIFVRGPLVARHGPDGWLDTGDLGSIDQAGRLHVCGRSDGMFVSGGENVYPQAVEAELREHPDVAEAAIVVVPDAEFGARMRALVVVRTGAAASPESLGAWLRERLDRHARPKTIDFVPALPHNVLGKIERTALSQVLPSERGKTAEREPRSPPH